MKTFLIALGLTFSLSTMAEIESFLKMSDQDLFNAALAGKVGKC